MKICKRNIIKNQQVYPHIFQMSNISSFYKNKGAKNNLKNERGVFNVVKLRSILDKLIYLTYFIYNLSVKF